MFCQLIKMTMTWMIISVWQLSVVLKLDRLNSTLEKPFSSSRGRCSGLWWSPEWWSCSSWACSRFRPTQWSGWRWGFAGPAPSRSSSICPRSGESKKGFWVEGSNPGIQNWSTLTILTCLWSFWHSWQTGCFPNRKSQFESHHQQWFPLIQV